MISTGQRNTIILNKKDGVLQMAYRTRIKYTYAQKQEIWDRWKKGESLISIGKELFDLRAYERQARCHSGPLTVSRQLIVNRLK